MFSRIQKTCLPGTWSRGVALARDRAVTLEPASDEVVARVQRSDRPVAAKVSLWPDDDDWFCDCNDRQEVCSHVAATVIALRAQGMNADSLGPASDGAAQVATPEKQARTSQLLYCFTRKDGRLALERRLRFHGQDEPLPSSLVSYVGGISSGRLNGNEVTATREDFKVDGLLSAAPHPSGPLDRATLSRLIPALAGASPTLLDGTSVRVSPKALRPAIVVSDEAGGYRVRAQALETGQSLEWFANGAVLEGDLLRAVEDIRISEKQAPLLTAEGARFSSPREIQTLVSELLPSLESLVRIEIATRRLPRLVQVSPRVELFLEHKAQSLMVYPKILYGNPPIAELTQEGLELQSPTEIPAREPEEENKLAKKLTAELQVRPFQWSRFEGEAAVQWLSRAQGWGVAGTGGKAFALSAEPLEAKVALGADGSLQLGFGNASGGMASAEAVLRAWSSGQSAVPLSGGGWAKLPQGWLEKYGSRISRLLEARGTGERLPPALLPEAIQAIEESGSTVPDALRRLRDRLANPAEITEAPLPQDLRAELRPYQRTGVGWLCFLRGSGMGAMLADDMGLGKTLQAMCAIRGRTLIVCPTSVLYSWTSQLEKFRPGLSHSLYHGSKRSLEARSDVVLTSYAVLRLDREKLTAEKWDTVVLDEAQTIKNPDSQAAQAAHALAGAEFRIALSGTPIENRLEDLWSQFQFLNPGLFGPRESFSGEAAKRARPFILRRLKREVAPELPPRTETVLTAELTSSEREIYDAILLASRKEVLEKLEEGGGRGVFAALEALLRLRQACCHTALIPGAAAQSEEALPSSKVTLLLECLSDASALGHRTLVFSQWTSLLDLIEPELRKAGLPFLRLDGSTARRDQVVEEFQKPSGPPVMLISLKAGGLGLTLTAADHIVLMDPWWNPAVEDQAADRAHRIGQTRPVLIRRLIAQGTVEERILALQQSKRDLAGELLNETHATASLTREDLLSLLA